MQPRAQGPKHRALQVPPLVLEHLAAGHGHYLWSCALCVRQRELEHLGLFPAETTISSADGEGASKVEGVI